MKYTKKKTVYLSNLFLLFFYCYLENAIIAAMKNHVYKFENEIKQQVHGAAIGLELTGEVAGVFIL